MFFVPFNDGTVNIVSLLTIILLRYDVALLSCRIGDADGNDTVVRYSGHER